MCPSLPCSSFLSRMEGGQERNYFVLQNSENMEGFPYWDPMQISWVSTCLPSAFSLLYLQVLIYFKRRPEWVRNPEPAIWTPLLIAIDLGQVLNLPEPQFPHL